MPTLLNRSAMSKLRSAIKRRTSVTGPRVLVTPNVLSPTAILVLRLALVALLFLLVFSLLLWDREGLKDHSDGVVSFTDVIYFTMITVTTVGYGDIVPVSDRARLIDALVVTPIRFAVWFLFLGTAYQLIIRQYMEGYRMAKLQATLKGHIIVCGFGHTGMSAAKELLARGVNPEQILVIDKLEERVRLAGTLGIAGFQADSTQEAALQEAVIDKAKAVIIAGGVDDSNALILLTARHLNPTVRIIMSAKEEENVKLFKQGGADAIISPATFGGYILAAAVDQGHMVHYLDDLLTARGKIALVERKVRPEEVQRLPQDLKPDLLLRLYRNSMMFSYADLDQAGRLQEGDILVLFTSRQSHDDEQTKS